MAIARRTFTIVFAAGAAFVVAALLWWALAVPALVKYPTDVDERLRYEGTLKLFVDPATASPLATPRVVPLTIERHVDADAEASSASRVVVKETITQTAGTITGTTENVYVMDRRSLENVADDRAYAYDPANVVDRSGAYRLNLPFGTDADDTYRIYKNEVATTYQMKADAATPETEAEGVTLKNFTGAGRDLPLSDAYLASLGRSLPLPKSLTPAQMAGLLKARGVDLQAVLASVAPALSAADAAALGQLAAQPVQLQYLGSFEGRAGIEPATGIQVRVASTDTISARPVLGGAQQLQALLTRYAGSPAVQAAAPVLQGLLAAAPIPVAEFSYDQTPASVAEIADDAESSRNQILAVERWVPLALLAVGIVLLIVGLAAWFGAGSKRFALPARPVGPQPKHA